MSMLLAICEQFGVTSNHITKSFKPIHKYKASLAEYAFYGFLLLASLEQGFMECPRKCGIVTTNVVLLCRFQKTNNLGDTEKFN